MAPTQLLSLAIKKRRSLYESKDRDYRKELLHTGMIQSLCKFLGEGRALRRRSRRRRSRPASATQTRTAPPTERSQKRPFPTPVEEHRRQPDDELPARYQLDNYQMEPINEPPPTQVTVVDRPADAMVAVTTDEDAVVPSIKRAKYEDMVNEPEREVLKEYAIEDFFSSLASFYTPDYYGGYSQEIEPTKDLYWCSTAFSTKPLDTDIDYWGLPPPDFEFMALCS